MLNTRTLRLFQRRMPKLPYITGGILLLAVVA